MRKLCAVFALSLLPLAAVAAGAQDPGESLPKLISHADAQYPPIARTARIMGDVVVKIITDGQLVVEAKAESGPPLLQNAAEDNAKTWKFAPHTPGTFRVTYRFKFMESNLVTSFPSWGPVVEVAAVPPTIPTIAITYAGRDLGTWKAMLASPYGKSSETLKFVATGRDGEWLNFHVLGETDTEYYEHDYGSVNGDFLSFVTKLKQPGGKNLLTCLSGKMSRDRIVGTFVDESGVRGTWTATQVRDSEKK
jgi:TonB family protein